ncbi:MAG: hypothetical protein ACTSV7_06215 [Candidatus Baldrarchaeia archaeon]
MPIFVQWKWQEKTKSFLVIFHFFDDYIRYNIRFRKKRFEGGKGLPAYRYFPKEHVSFPITPEEPVQFKTVMTWSPSHIELGLLSELLNYANIINGLKEDEKRKLKEKFEGENSYLIDQLKPDVMDKGYYVLLGYEFDKGKKANWVFCVELCAEYIDHLKKLLKPYLNK